MADKHQPPKKSLLYNAIIVLLVMMFLNAFVFPLFTQPRVTEVTYDKFLAMLDKGEVREVALDDSSSTILFLAEVEGAEGIYRTGAWPDDDLTQRLLSHPEVSFETEIIEETSPLVQILLGWVLPYGLIFGAGYLLMRNMQKRMGGENAMSFGKANAKIVGEEKTGVTFNDVAGEDEAKEALGEIVDFLHDPKRYSEIGAKLPKGALLVGPPGTGKTLLAKAVAGEAHVPFFSISGSEFVQMFVGMGAAKVRDLFKQAAEKAPCIVFIDEIDTIGKKRDGGVIGGNDEREQTLNQLLTEMDGFDANKGVVILAATNRPDSLDPALLRPGRFDRRIPVELPDLAGREAILRVHARQVKLEKRIDFTAIARATSGASGAELANIINEAALRAVREGRNAVSQSDLEESVETVIAGYQRKNAVLSEHEKRVVSYHEVGHALVAALQSNTAPVTKITIVPRTSGALGYTMQVDQDEKKLLTREELLSKIAVLTGGRAAEEVVFGSGDHRRVERHRAGDEAGAGDDHALRHVGRVRHGGHGDGQQPVPGRRHLPGLLPGHGHGHRPAGGGRGARPARQGRGASEEEHGLPQPRGRIPLPRGDDHRRTVHGASARPARAGRDQRGRGRRRRRTGVKTFGMENRHSAFVERRFCCTISQSA